MIPNDRISRLAQQLGERLQDASHAPEEIQRNVHHVMRGAFERMELVTREDFDILMDVLQRTRSRVEALEKQVAALEASLDAETPSAESAAPVSAGETATAPAPDDATSERESAGTGEAAAADEPRPADDDSASR
ncbi:MAG: hypothetical protein AWU55_3074 [Halomonadaceae bacterium T82-2]|nr:MAG: hypothetical protein AWU55_3074 [Halomonadaceae bacterium T82-2]